MVESQSKNAGRNNNGRITTRHQGGGHKQHYRLVDFKRNKDGVPAKVERIEYDQTARPILPCSAMPTVSAVMSSRQKAWLWGSKSLAVPRRRSSPVMRCRCTQHPRRYDDSLRRDDSGKGAQLARSAGTSAQLLAREGVYAQLRLRSGEIRGVHVECRATIGEVGNEEHSLRSIGGRKPLARDSADRARRG